MNWWKDAQHDHFMLLNEGFGQPGTSRAGVVSRDEPTGGGSRQQTSFQSNEQSVWFGVKCEDSFMDKHMITMHIQFPMETMKRIRNIKPLFVKFKICPIFPNTHFLKDITKPILSTENPTAFLVRRRSWHKSLRNCWSYERYTTRCWHSRCG